MHIAIYLSLNMNIDDNEKFCSLLKRADILWRKFKDKEALDYAQQAAMLDNDNVFALFILARTQWSLEDYASALLNFEAILRNNGRCTSCYSISGRSLYSVKTDANYYIADCLYHLFRDKDALPFISEHLKMRGRGVKSDVSKQKVLELYKVLVYSRRPQGNVPKEEDYASPKQRESISKRIDGLIADRDYNKLVRYLKHVLKRFPGDYFIKLQLSEYLPKIGDKKGALQYAEEAYGQASEDALVVFDYADALWLNDSREEALHYFQAMLDMGIDYIAYSEHGEGLRYAKRLIRTATWCGSEIEKELKALQK